MYRWELEDENLYLLLRFYLQGLLPDSFLQGQVKALGDVAFSYGQGLISPAEFRKAIISWFQGQERALNPVVIKRSLTRKQERFISAYLEYDGNGAEAARRAGYSERSARKLASRNLRKPEIRKRLEDRGRHESAE